MAQGVRLVKPSKQVKVYRAPRQPIHRTDVEVGRKPALVPRFGTSIAEQERQALERRAVPLTKVYGTILERIVYKALQEKHVAFSFQTSLLGGRLQWGFGRQVADFVLYQQRLIIEVQGAYWHSPLSQAAVDERRRLVLAAEGWQVLYLPERIVLNETLLEEWIRRNVLHPGIAAQSVTSFGMSHPLSGEKAQLGG